MKKLLAVILAAALILPASAAQLPADEDVRDILDVMEIMTYDARGSFNDGSYVTRAALAKILVSASLYKGAATSSSRVSPFSDVSYKHWGAPYISVAAKNAFMTGYANGTFKPDKYITYEESVSAMLKLLGYTNADYTGAYPAGQLAKAEDIGLTENITAIVGNPLTRTEMSHLVYNLLNTPSKTSGEKVHAEALGYTLSSELLTLGDVIRDNVTGPVTVKAGTVASLGLTSPKTYRDGKASTAEKIENYDVIYYSTKSNVIWAYSKKITGVLDAIAPNKESPSSVTVSGNAYPVTYYAAQRAFGLDGLELGQTVTMLLDKNGSVCDAYMTTKLYENDIGVVTAVTPKTVSGADGSKVSGYYTTVLMLDGSKVDIEQSTSSTALIGKAVQIDYKTSAITSISSVASGSYSGFVSADGLKWGASYPIAYNAKLLEVDDNGNTVSLTLDRLDGVKLSASNVLLTSKNSSGAIDGMIIKDVTGDTMKYGLVTDVDKNFVADGTGSSAPSKYVYRYTINGTPYTASFTGILADAGEGPARFLFEDGVLDKIENLKRTANVLSINPSFITCADGTKHRISTNVLVYKIVDDEKIVTDLDEAVAYDGTIWPFYDKPQSEGGLVRIIYLK